MGYMGLKNYGESDMAHSLAIEAIEAMTKKLKSGVRLRENSYNTDGCVNVALFNEAFILPAAREYSNVGLSMDELGGVLLDARDRLNKVIAEMEKVKNKGEEFGDYDNYRMHINAYKRMVKNLNKTLSHFDTE